VVLKLSGEVLAGGTTTVLDHSVLTRLASEIVSATEKGVAVAVVLGGGNILRGANEEKAGRDRVVSDQMGMLATIINSMALAEALRRCGGKGRALSVIPVGPLAELYTRDRALEIMRNGGVAVVGGGTGLPYVSTDTAAALRAAELGAGLLLKATKVDGVYDRDPALHENAKRFKTIAFSEALGRNLKVMDTAAFALCREAGIPIRVFDYKPKGAVTAALLGKPLGSLVVPG